MSQRSGLKSGAPPELQVYGIQSVLQHSTCKNFKVLKNLILTFEKLGTQFQFCGTICTNMSLSATGPQVCFFVFGKGLGRAQVHIIELIRFLSSWRTIIILCKVTLLFYFVIFPLHPPFSSKASSLEGFPWSSLEVWNSPIISNKNNSY